jgi:hypothetical protein
MKLRVFSIILITFAITVMTMVTPERQDGLKALEVAIAKIQEVIKSSGGMCNIKMGVSN